MIIRAFRAWRPAPELAVKVAGVPYDVVSAEEASALAKDNPDSFLHISRSEIDLPPGTNPYAPEVYARARAAFDSFRARGVLMREKTPCLYLYRQKMGRHEQTGLVACCSTSEYARGLIKKHELTRTDKEDDRTRHINALNAQSGPVFLACREQPGLLQLFVPPRETQPIYDFVAPDGIAHTVWRISETARIVEAFRNVPALYIADGHHRAAGAARVAKERASAADNQNDSSGEWNFFLAVIFPAATLKIMPYNRLVHDLNGLALPAFEGELKRLFNYAENAGPEPAAERNVSVYFAGRWRGISWAHSANADPVANLDASVLQSRLLQPVLGIDDPRTSKRIDFVGGIRGVAELQARVDSGECAAAFSMFPVQMSRIMDVADSGGIMPPKSTWFEPKLRSGLLVHELEE